MSPQSVFGLQFLFSLLVIGLSAKRIVAPWLVRRLRSDALFWLILPHSFRSVAVFYIAPEAFAEGAISLLSSPAAIGSVLAGVLALTALLFLRMTWTGALLVVWIFNIVGTIDLLNIVRHAEANFGGAWYIPTIVAPILLVTHIMIFDRLPKRATKAQKSISK